MKTLVIPDIHNKVEIADLWIKHSKADKFIFLGDFFDSYGDNASDAIKTAYWLKNSLKQENRIHLFGNHDIPYFKRNSATDCPGWSKSKSDAINQILTLQDWNKFDFIYKEMGFFLSHAGITYPTYSAFLNGNIENVFEEEIKCKNDFKNGIKHWFLNGSHARMLSLDMCPGLLWTDWNQEFAPIRGCNQIVGHSFGNEPRYERAYPFGDEDGDNCCIDCGLKYAILFNEGKINLLKDKDTFPEEDSSWIF